MEYIDVVTRFIQNLGFPIFVAVWLLYRSDKIIKANTVAILKLTEVVRNLYKGV